MDLPLYNDDPYILRPDPHILRCRRILQYATLLLSIILATATTIAQSLYIKEAYHTSVLSGEAWVLELLCGHSQRIRTELGVSHEVFDALLTELRAMGYHDSRFVSLKEQLAIFLYTSVTGLTIRHVGRFQRSNETISR